MSRTFASGSLSCPGPLMLASSGSPALQLRPLSPRPSAAPSRGWPGSSVRSPAASASCPGAVSSSRLSLRVCVAVCGLWQVPLYPSAPDAGQEGVPGAVCCSWSAEPLRAAPAVVPWSCHRCQGGHYCSHCPTHSREISEQTPQDHIQGCQVTCKSRVYGI